MYCRFAGHLILTCTFDPEVPLALAKIHDVLVVNVTSWWTGDHRLVDNYSVFDVNKSCIKVRRARWCGRPHGEGSDSQCAC